MFTYRLTYLVAFGGLLVLFASFAHPRAHAQPNDERCFEATNQCISGPIRAYWESNGGLSVFGYPITPQRTETVEGRTLPVQWFERDRLEIQQDEPQYGRVTAGRLGARYLELTGRPWETFTVGTPQDGCMWMEATRHNLCEPFLSYWQQNGGLMRFGYPITEAFMEDIEGKRLLVQYFERRRMEHHTHLPGQPILFGLLGKSVLNLREGGATPAPAPTSAPASAEVPECVTDYLDTSQPEWARMLEAYKQVTFREALGCPVMVAWSTVDAATQSMEFGQMIWIDVPGSGAPAYYPPWKRIFALINPTNMFRSYPDTWEEGEDPNIPSGFEPPRDGLYAPWGGFGKVWAEDATLRDQIGWATQPQADARTAAVVTFDLNNQAEGRDPGFMVLIKETNIVYVFGDTATPAQYQVIEP
jgi:hypothetical protein